MARSRRHAQRCRSVRRGALTVDKVTIVVDSGHVINPHNAIEQCEGSVCWELSHALFGGLDLREGRFTNTNFDTYNLVRIDQMPDVDVHFRAVEGQVGRARRTRGAARAARGRECRVLRDRQAHAFDAVSGSQSELELIPCCSGRTRSRERRCMHIVRPEYGPRARRAFLFRDGLLEAGELQRNDSILPGIVLQIPDGCRPSVRRTDRAAPPSSPSGSQIESAGCERLIAQNRCARTDREYFAILIPH